MTFHHGIRNFILPTLYFPECCNERRSRLLNLTLPVEFLAPIDLQMVSTWTINRMVDDKSNDDLICWSENGDSFFVRQPERFAPEVLGKWFKHSKYSSFVRQLNNYGFQKVPHLQQGALPSDSIHEYHHYLHSNFRLNRQDLLGHIQRKDRPVPNHPIQSSEVGDPFRPVSMSEILSADNDQLLKAASLFESHLGKLEKDAMALCDEIRAVKAAFQQL